MDDRLEALSDAGVSIWLDDLSRERLETGNLADLIKNSARRRGDHQPDDLRLGAGQGRAVRRAGRAAWSAAAPTVDDVDHRADHRRRAQRLRRLHARCSRPPTASTAGCRSRSSPAWRSTPRRRSQPAQKLWRKVDRPNLFIKIPATPRGCRRSPQTLGEGISVNVTLIFGLDRYDAGDGRLPRRASSRPRQRPRPVHDPLGRLVLRLPGRQRDRQAAGGDRHRGGAGAARARPRSPTPGWPTSASRRSSAASGSRALAEAGAHPQRPLWASTGVKNPDYSDTMYVADLVVADTVNTMPEKTMDAFADHGEVTGDTVRGTYDEAHDVMDRLGGVGIDYDDVIATLEQRGRRQVREVLGRAGRDRRGPDGRRARGVRCSERRTLDASSSPPAPRADAIAAHVPTLVADQFASGLFAQDATLWGPEAEPEAAKRLVVGRAAALVASPGGRDRGAARRARLRRGRRPRRALRHGRLVARPRGDLRDRRRRADRAGLQRPRPGPRPPRRTGSTAPSSWCRRSPARRSRPTPSAGRSWPRYEAGIDPKTRARHRDRPRQPARQLGPRRRLPRGQRRPRRRWPLLRAHRVRAGAERAGRRRHRRAAGRGRDGRRPLAADDDGQPGRCASAPRWPAPTRCATSWCSSTRAPALVGLRRLGRAAHRREHRQERHRRPPGRGRGPRPRGHQPAATLTVAQLVADTDGGGHRPSPTRTTTTAAPRCSVAGSLGAQMLLWEVGHRGRRSAARDQPVRPARRRERQERRPGDARRPARTPSRATSSTARSRSAALGGDWLGDAGTLEAAVTALLAQLDAEQGYVAVMAYLDRLEHADARGRARRPRRAAQAPDDVRLGTAVPALHRPVPQGRPARRGLPPDHRRRPARTSPIPGRDFGFGTFIAAQAAGDANVLADHGRPVLRLHLDDPTTGLAPSAGGARARRARQPAARPAGPPAAHGRRALRHGDLRCHR